MIKYIVPVVLHINKWLFCFLLITLLISGKTGKDHPFHVSVAEINHNKEDKTLEITCKIFTDDFENVLRQNYKVKVDLINPPDKAAMDTLVKKYLSSHINIASDGISRPFEYLGFERDHEAVYSYVQIGQIPVVRKIDIVNKLMHDMFNDQVNIMHVVVDGRRKSHRLDYPDSLISFQF